MSSKINYGIILGLISAASGIVFYSLGPESMIDSSWISYIFMALGIGLTIYFGTKLRDENGGYFTFGQAYGSLMIMSIVAALISGVVSFVLYTIIDPGFGEAYLDLLREQMYNQGMTEEQIEMGMSFTKWMNPFGAIGIGASILISIIGSAFINLIFAAIIKKNPPENYSNIDEKEDILA